MINLLATFGPNPWPLLLAGCVVLLAGAATKIIRIHRG